MSYVLVWRIADEIVKRKVVNHRLHVKGLEMNDVLDVDVDDGDGYNGEMEQRIGV